MTTVKRPESVLVVVYVAGGYILMMRRVEPPDFWQSVTGSLGWGESASSAAAREVREETGLSAAAPRDLGIVNRFPIIEPWRRRYAPDAKENTEYVFSLALPGQSDIKVSPAEHSEYRWLDWRTAAEMATSWTNREAILALARLENWQ